MAMHFFFFLTMFVVLAQGDIVPSPAEGIVFSVVKDERSFLCTPLTATSYSNRCLAAALNVCGTEQEDSSYVSFMEEAREVMQQLSVVASKLDSHLSAAVTKSDSDLSASVNESDSQLSTAVNECESQVRVAINNWESNISSADNTSESLPRHCKDLLDSGDNGSGLRQVYPYPDRPLQSVMVLCDHTIDGGGWTVLQLRTSDAVRQDFYRNWTEYEFGFGDLRGEFWMGLILLHQFTSTTLQQLRIDLDDYEGEHRWAKYGYFHVGGPNDNYRLGVGSYSGDAGDSFTNHNGHQFTTHDADNDGVPSSNCAELHEGGWWYTSCFHSSLNGYHYAGANSPIYNGIVWYHWRGWSYSLKRTSMMIRPAV